MVSHDHNDLVRFGPNLTASIEIDVYFMLIVHKYISNQISMSKKCLRSDVEMAFVIRCLLDVEFRS